MTCGVWVSIAAMSALASSITDAMSLMISVLVRSSRLTVPLAERRRFTSPSVSRTEA